MDLEDVVGGRYTVGMRLTRGYVDSLKGLTDRINQHDGAVANNLRGDLPDSVTSKQRPWLNGHSINSITRPLQIYDLRMFPPF